MKKHIRSIIFIIVLFIVLFVMCINVPNMQLYSKKGELYISEIMSSNEYTIRDKFNKSSDYIEIYNGYDEDINLEGYYLSDDSNQTKKWIFPNIVLKSKEYLVVFASGKDTVIDGELHTNFKLDTKGESVILSNSEGKIISKIYSNNSLKDTSYGFDKDKYVYYYVGTPGYENSGKTSDVPITEVSSNIKLYINEYLVNNKILKAYDKKYYGLIELYNDEDVDINLNGYYLTDSTFQLDKYTFGDIKICSKCYLKVYMSGLNTIKDNEIHSSFTLSNKTKNIIISNSYKKVIHNIKINEYGVNTSGGLYKGNWYSYANPSIGEENNTNYINGSVVKDVIINEVVSIGNAGVELKNLTDHDISLKGYLLSDKSGYTYDLSKITIKANSYVVIYASKSESIKNDKYYMNMSINNHNEVLYLYKNNVLIDTFNVDKLINNVSCGIGLNGTKVYYKDITLGSKNSSDEYKGYTNNILFSINGGYVKEGTKVSLNTLNGGDIYYTLDGSFPTNKSSKYTEPIIINKTTVIKAIAYKDGYIQSDTISRTYFVNDTHDISIISISADNKDLFSDNGLFVRFRTEMFKKISFEFYESNGKLGVDFVGETKLVGADSRNQPQKSMAVYLRKEYGLQEVTYPFFEDGDTYTYSSFTIRNSGEDPNKIKLKDAFLVKVLTNQMDIDAQEYRPVAVYINGDYYGLYYLREKVNGDYIESNYNVEKGDFDLIKGNVNVKEGSMAAFDNLTNYLKTHDIKDSKVYEYVKTQVDVQELMNYWIVQTFYANTDTGNIAFWKSSEGKWRWILFDQDWAMYPTTYSYVGLFYPFEPYGHGTRRYFSTYLTYRLYQNSEFKDQYLKTLAYHLKTTFKPDRMISILDDMAKEIESEMPKHINRWHDVYLQNGMGYLSSVNGWKNNIETMKRIINGRYNLVLKRLKSDFKLSDAEYQKYFGDLS